MAFETFVETMDEMERLYKASKRGDFYAKSTLEIMQGLVEALFNDHTKMLDHSIYSSDFGRINEGMFSARDHDFHHSLYLKSLYTSLSNQLSRSSVAV